MRFTLLLYALYAALKVASVSNKAFKHYIRKASIKILIKTASGDPARLYIFDKGRVSTLKGDHKDFDVALVWKDAATGFSVMTDKSKDATFKAASQGKLQVIGMSVYAQWFENAVALVL